MPNPELLEALDRRAAVLILDIYHRHIPHPRQAAAWIREKRGQTRPELLPALSRSYSKLRRLSFDNFNAARLHLYTVHGLEA